MIENDLQKKLRKIREDLKKGRATLNPDGSFGTENQDSENRLNVPKGKLANFYWYENYPKLLEGEKDLMRTYFPQFKCEKLENGKIMWAGTLKSDRNNAWTIAVVYQNDHPNNDDYGGSIRIYSIFPDIDDYWRELGRIPHVVKDENGMIFLCTARSDDFKASKDDKNRVIEATTAVSALAWASKWIFLFESWIHEEISEDEFESNKY